MTDPRSFGDWLRRERERRDITVRAIADRTKIGSGLLESLERGDVSRWPGGIYRRAFLRSYADAVGLDADLVLANFERLFPSHDSQPAAAPRAAAVVAVRTATDDEPEMRLQFASTPSATKWTAARTACLDVALVVGAGLLGFAAAGAIGFWCVAAVTAVVSHVTGVLGIRSQPAFRTQERVERQPAPRPLAPVVVFSDEQSRSTSRRARARRMAAALSAVAIPAASFRRRRAARS